MARITYASQLRDFDREVSKRAVSPYVVWARLESMAMFLQLDYVDIWFSKC